jgi:hypothetical protein
VEWVGKAFSRSQTGSVDKTNAPPVFTIDT